MSRRATRVGLPGECFVGPEQLSAREFEHMLARRKIEPIGNSRNGVSVCSMWQPSTCEIRRPCVKSTRRCVLLVRASQSPM